MGIVCGVCRLEQSGEAVIFESDALNQPLRVAARQIRCYRPESLRTFAISPGSFEIPSHLTLSLQPVGVSRRHTHPPGAHRPLQAGIGLRSQMNWMCAAGDVPASLRRACLLRLTTTPQASARRTYHCGKPETARAHHMSQKWPKGSTAPPPFPGESVECFSMSGVADSLHLVGQVRPLSCEVEI